VYVRLAHSSMAPSLSTLLPRQTDQRVVLAGSSLSLLYWLHSSLLIRPSPKKGDETKVVINSGREVKDKKVQVDAKFYESLKGLAPVLVPGLLSKEAALMALVAASLLGRSVCDIWMIDNATKIESAIISRHFHGYKRLMCEFLLAVPLISMVNNLMKYGLSSLKLQFRKRLSDHLYNEYLKGLTYYQMSNLDSRISNGDQLLTQDVERFCDCAVELYSNLSKPLLDTLMYIKKLSEGLGPHAPAGLLLYSLLSGSLLAVLRRPVSRLTAEEQRLEGELRYVHSRLITNSEEVAFYGGNVRERQTIQAALNRLVRHIRYVISFRFSIGFVDNIIAKYLATMVGFGVVAVPFMTDTALSRDSHQRRMEFYYTSGRIMLKLVQSIGRIMLATREMSKLAGYTARMEELRTVLKDIAKGRFQRTQVAEGAVEGAPEGGSPPALPPSGGGEVVTANNVIRFREVPLVTPNGDVLVPSLSFEVQSGMNVLVCGPNGSGKSSLFRVLGQLWPVLGGVLTKPPHGKLFYIPQRPYMTLGSLRDQVIYPDTTSRLPDDELMELLRLVQLGGLVAREGGWGAVGDWMDVLSGGEKQRVAMARVFYHRPQFAILDECTSAVSADVEDAMYGHCRALGISLFTVSHRRSLWKHHQYYLHLSGGGDYQFLPITEATEPFGS